MIEPLYDRLTSGALVPSKRTLFILFGIRFMSIYKKSSFLRFIAVVLCVSWAFSSSALLAVEEEEFHPFRGVHLLATYSGCDYEALTNLETLKSEMEAAVRASGATILDKSTYEFLPDALTMVFLLSESHASIHTYPEYGACFVDLFTCGYKTSAEDFDAVLRAYLKPKQVTNKTFIRHHGIEEQE